MHREDANEADQVLNTEEAKISDGANLISVHLTLLTTSCASCISARSTQSGTACNVNATYDSLRVRDGRRAQSALMIGECALTVRFAVIVTLRSEKACSCETGSINAT